MQSIAQSLPILIVLASWSSAVPARAGEIAPQAPISARASTTSRADEVARPGGDACALEALTDEPIAPERAQLLDLAFEAACELPLVPHAKTRSRLQEQVVTTWLELGQRRRALAAIEGIEGWRKAAAQADLAYECARRGEIAAARQLLERAAKTPGGEVEPDADWRQERVQARIARALLSLGDREGAALCASGVSEAEAGPIASARAALLDAKELEVQLENLDRVAAGGSFEQLRNALAVQARLFERFYDDAARRQRIARGIERCWSKLPVPIRVDTALELAKTALAHGDREESLVFVAKARGLIEGAVWTPDLLIPVAMKIAAASARAGSVEVARAEVEAALRGFEADRGRILDIDRADLLRSIADAETALGDDAAALATWRLAADAGVANPNSRPRAEDLVATCTALAASRLEPDAGLRSRLAEIRHGLGRPW